MCNGPKPFSPYTGRWIARIGSRIICQGGSPSQVFAGAKSIRGKESIILSYLPNTDIMLLPPIFYQIQQILAEEPGVFLVGGAIRNVLLGQEINDLDFAVSGNTGKIARRVCNLLHTDFYTLDSSRETYRLILQTNNGKRLYVDFSKMRGATIDADLTSRDFTINAMAVNLNDPLKLIDPLGGAIDLQGKIVRACCPQSIADDPIRILRAIRFAAEGGYKIAEDTKKNIKSNVGMLNLVSPERKRDELFKIISLDLLPAALKALDWMHAIPAVFPGNKTKIPAQGEVFRTGIDFSSSLEINRLIKTITRRLPIVEEATLLMGLADSVLGSFRQELRDYLNHTFTLDRNYFQLIHLSNIIRLISRSVEINPADSSRLASNMNLSRDEIRFISTLVIDPGRIDKYFEVDFRPSGKDIYHFFKIFKEAGIGATVLFLGSYLAAKKMDIDPDEWRTLLEKTSIFWDSWFNKQSEVVNPAPLLDGNQISNEFEIAAGPLVGKCIEILKIEQAAGNVRSKGEAVSFIRNFLRTID